MTMALSSKRRRTRRNESILIAFLLVIGLVSTVVAADFIIPDPSLGGFSGGAVRASPERTPIEPSTAAGPFEGVCGPFGPLGDALGDEPSSPLAERHCGSFGRSRPE